MNITTYKINVKTPASIVKILILTMLFVLGNSQKQLFAQQVKDTIKIDTLRPHFKVSKDTIDAPVNYNATDSGVMFIKSKEFYLYGKAKTNYKTSNLEAAIIKYDQQKQDILAYGAKDTSGSIMSNPKFTEGDIVSLNDSIFFNMKSAKGLTKNTFFQQGEIYVNAQRMKKVNQDEAFAWKAKFTTCNLDDPHFAFVTNRLKIVNNKIGVSGITYPSFEGVPLPIGIPFGIFPLTKGRHSGFMAPAFSSSEDFGLGFEGLGYYKVISDHIDATIRSNIYSYGGWNANLNTKYIFRYRFLGNFNLALQKTRALNRNPNSLDEFTGGQTFMINWSHSMDAKALPGTSFSANVNFGSTKFNKNLLNNPYQNYQNQISSSISYTKTWNNKYNLSVNLNHSQNNNLGLVNMSLPNINFNMLTLYPFQNKDQIGAGKWYEKIGIGYNGSFQNQFSFYDTAFNMQRLLDTMQWGASHNVPISVTLPALGPINITPGVTFEEKWFGQQVIRSWNSKLNQVETSINRGFYRAPHVGFSLGAATRIFGTYNINGNTVQKIRHEIRPNISFNYTPDLASNYYYSTQIDSTGRRYRFSKFEGSSMGGAYSEGTFGGMAFGIDNLLEMKVKNPNDTTQENNSKKVKLIDGFGFNSNYNFLADSFKLGNFSFYARTTLFEKFNITSMMMLDPYVTDNKGFRVNKLDIDPAAFKFGHISNGSISISTSFKSKDKKGKDKDKNIPIDPFMTQEEQQRQLQYTRANPAEFTDFDIPWSLSFSYSFNFTRILKKDFSGFTTNTYSSLNFNGDFSLTPKWKIGGTGFVDVAKMNIQQLSMFISREMHCWQLSINVTPIGIYRSFNISVSPKSGILRDLRINRSRTFSSMTY